MASNPIKRRARQSFFLGFLIALVIMAIVVMLLFTKINALNEENEKLKVVGPKVSVYTVTEDIDPDEPITIDMLQATTMQLAANATAMDTSSYIDPTIFYETDEETNEEKERTFKARVTIPAGSVVTEGMLKEEGIDNDERLMEYSSIVLPSQLNNGDYIDIRLRLADGSEKIVLSKKKVQQSTQNSIWMKMKEIEILTMNSAIVDAYLVKGSQLRATVYTNAIMQDATEATYSPNPEVVIEIDNNPNILKEAINGLKNKWFTTGGTPTQSYIDQRNTYESYISEENNTTDKRAETIDSAYSTEASTINQARGEYVSALQESGIVGTTY